MNILFFDDETESLINKLFIGRLTREIPNCHVESVKYPDEAIKLAAVKCYDIIILDIIASWPHSTKRPESHKDYETGIEVLGTLLRSKMEGSGRKPKILFRSARGENSIRNTCLENGADGYYNAGMEDSELIKFIDRIRDGVSEERAP